MRLNETDAFTRVMRKLTLSLFSTMGGYNVKSAIHNPEESSHQNWTMLVPGAQISGLQNCKKFIVCNPLSLEYRWGGKFSSTFLGSLSVPQN